MTYIPLDEQPIVAAKQVGKRFYSVGPRTGYEYKGTITGVNLNCLTAPTFECITDDGLHVTMTFYNGLQSIVK